jgi:hypothetical protein
LNPNDFIRYFLGDLIVVILIYTSIRTILNSSKKTTALAVLIISFSIESLQYFNGISLLGLENNTLAKLIIGTTFSWTDLLAYSIGIGIIISTEKINLFHQHNPEDKKSVPTNSLQK